MNKDFRIASTDNGFAITLGTEVIAEVKPEHKAIAELWVNSTGPVEFVLVEPELLATAYCYLERLMVTTPYPTDLVEFMEQLSNLILNKE